MRFHHIAVAVSDIEHAFKALFAEAPTRPLTHMTFDSEQRAYLRLLDVGGLAMELVQGGPVADWLRRGCKLYHICFEVDDLDQTLEEAKAADCVLVSPAKPAVLFDGRRVAFVMDRVLGLVEYLEKG